MATRLRRFVPTVLAATRRHTMIYALGIARKAPELNVLSREIIQNAQANERAIPFPDRRGARGAIRSRLFAGSPHQQTRGQVTWSALRQTETGVCRLRRCFAARQIRATAMTEPNPIGARGMARGTTGSRGAGDAGRMARCRCLGDRRQSVHPGSR